MCVCVIFIAHYAFILFTLHLSQSPGSIGEHMQALTCDVMYVHTYINGYMACRFRQRSLKEVVRLQAGDEANTRAWRLFCSISRQGFQDIYRLLKVGREGGGEKDGQLALMRVP